ncbi:hypothetical protein QOZ80_5BG0420330 [Eleusine coracana subsp. coracana]|nr:hypothetical protein QOZ80_5BG0420330 [Eleusine coracana subsp. coracana]
MADAKEVAAGSGNDAQMRTRQAATTFAELGVCPELVAGCDAMGWTKPTKIQAEAIPNALQGRDLIALAHTGSGKTAAFALPIMQALLEQRKSFFACVLSPTRELAIQISEQFQALESSIGVVCTVDQRLGALNRFKAKECKILTCRDVASRGLDIQGVDIVINYDFPLNSKDYVHRVGRTARAGESGCAVSLVNQYEAPWFKMVEQQLGKVICQSVANKDVIEAHESRVAASKSIALRSLKESGAFKKRKRTEDY